MIDLLCKGMATALGVMFLSSCSSGDEDTATLPVVTFPTSAVAFNVTGPDDSTPASQTLTGTLSANAIYMAALTEGTAIERVTYSLSGKTASIRIHPKSPSELGPGLHSARITVFGQVCADANCSQLASGPAEYINVSYPIPQIIREIAPYVVHEQTSGSVVVRGAGFREFTINGVSFGGFPASEFSITSDTQMEASHPPFAAGRYPIQLQVDDAPVPVRSDAELVVVAPPAFVAASIPYPIPDPDVIKLLYDAERSALLLVTTLNGGELLRLRYAGNSWSVDTLPINSLHDIALSANGRTLLAVTDNSVIPIDADTLATGSAWNVGLESGRTFTGIAVANDGNAILTTTAGNNNATPLYSFDPRTGDFTRFETSLLHAVPVASADGSLILLPQQDTGSSTTPVVYQYSASSGSLSTTSLSVNRNEIPTVVDRSAVRFALNGRGVYSSASDLLGTIPDSTLAVAFSPDGSRLYAYDSLAAAVVVYDTTKTVEDGSTLNVVDSYIDIMGDPGAKPRLAVSSAGDAVFLAGTDKLVVIPVGQP